MSTGAGDNVGVTADRSGHDVGVTATSHHPTSPSLTCGETAENWNVVDSRTHARLSGEDPTVARLALDPEAGGIIAIQSLTDLLASCSGVLTDDAAREAGAHMGCDDVGEEGGVTEASMEMDDDGTGRRAYGQDLAGKPPDGAQMLESEHQPAAPASPCSEDMDASDSTAPWVTIDWAAGAAKMTRPRKNKTKKKTQSPEKKARRHAQHVQNRRQHNELAQLSQK